MVKNNLHLNAHEIDISQNPTLSGFFTKRMIIHNGFSCKETQNLNIDKKFLGWQ